MAGESTAPFDSVSQEDQGHFRVLGIPVRVYPSFFIMALFLGMPRGFDTQEILQTLLWMGVVAVSILWHELGHAVAARRFGGRPSIQLYSFGGLTYHNRAAELPPWQRIMVSLAGPVAGFALGAATLGIEGLIDTTNPAVSFGVHQLKWVNIGWGALNLLPILPLDGGNVMASAIRVATGRRDDKAARWISVGVGVAATATALWLSWFWAAIIAAWCSARNFSELRERPPANEEGWQKRVEQLRERINQGDKTAVHDVERLVSVAQNPQYRATCLELLGWVYLSEDDARRAAETFRLMPEGYQPSSDLKAEVLLRTEKPARAVKMLEEELGDSPSCKSVQRLALAYVQSKDFERAVSLLLDGAGKNCERDVFAHVAQALFYADQFTLTQKLEAEAFGRFGAADDAYNVACSLARQSKAREALGWLERAIDAGYNDGEHLDADTDLDALCVLPEYTAVRSRLAQEAAGQG